MPEYSLSVLSSFGVFDMLAAGSCFCAAWISGRCARQPIYHSSMRQRRIDRRFWATIVAIVALAGVYQLIGGEVLVWKLGSRFVQTVQAHSSFVQWLFVALMVSALIVALVMAWALMGSGLRRNGLAGWGVVATALALIGGVAVVHARSTSAVEALLLEPDYQLQALGVLVGAILITSSALVYGRRRSNQFRWRRQLDPAGGQPIVHTVNDTGTQ